MKDEIIRDVPPRREDDDALTEDEDRGIVDALRQLDGGEGIPLARVIEELRRAVDGG